MSMTALYFLVGIFYCIVNASVRKLDHDDDWMLILCWVLLWPIFILALIIDRSFRSVRGYRRKQRLIKLVKKNYKL